MKMSKAFLLWGVIVLSFLAIGCNDSDRSKRRTENPPPASVTPEEFCNGFVEIVGDCATQAGNEYPPSERESDHGLCLHGSSQIDGTTRGCLGTCYDREKCDAFANGVDCLCEKECGMGCNQSIPQSGVQSIIE